MFVFALKTKTHSPTSLTLFRIEHYFHTKSAIDSIEFIQLYTSIISNIFFQIIECIGFHSFLITPYTSFIVVYMVPLLFGANWWNVIWLGAAMFYVVIWWWDKTEVANFPPSIMSVKLKDIQWNHACNSIKACCTKRKLPPIKLASQTNSIGLSEKLGEISPSVTIVKHQGIERNGHHSLGTPARLIPIR